MNLLPGAKVRMLAKSPLVLAALALAGCGDRVHERAGAPSHAPVSVVTLTFAVAPIAGGLELPGRVKAVEEVTVSARITARLTTLARREGDFVTRGAVLARFEADETRDVLAAAHAELVAASLALEVATRQEARLESLWVARVVSQRERELAESVRRDAAARHAAARAEHERLDSGSLLRAPFSGRVVRRHADPGADLVAGAPVVDLRSEGEKEIVVAVPEGALPLLDGGTPRTRLGALWVETPLARLDAMTDWRTRSRIAYLRAPAAAEPGAYVRVRLGGDGAAGRETGRGTVPESSLVRRGGLTGVFIVDEGQARLRWLKLGRASNGRVEVLAGLFEGDRVALDPRALADGRSVTPGP
jgi:RND family efflux transporter MFP subunit